MMTAANTPPKSYLGTPNRDSTPDQTRRKPSLPLSPGGASTFSERCARDATFSEFIFDRLALARDFDIEFELAIHSPARTGTALVYDKIRMWKRGTKIRCDLVLQKPSVASLFHLWRKLSAEEKAKLEAAAEARRNGTAPPAANGNLDSSGQPSCKGTASSSSVQLPSEDSPVPRFSGDDSVPSIIDNESKADSKGESDVIHETLADAAANWWYGTEPDEEEQEVETDPRERAAKNCGPGGFSLLYDAQHPTMLEILNHEKRERVFVDIVAMAPRNVFGDILPAISASGEVPKTEEKEKEIEENTQGWNKLLGFLVGTGLTDPTFEAVQNWYGGDTTVDISDQFTNCLLWEATANVKLPSKPDPRPFSIAMAIWPEYECSFVEGFGMSETIEQGGSLKDLDIDVEQLARTATEGMKSAAESVAWAAPPGSEGAIALLTKGVEEMSAAIIRAADKEAANTQRQLASTIASAEDSEVFACCKLVATAQTPEELRRAVNQLLLATLPSGDARESCAALLDRALLSAMQPFLEAALSRMPTDFDESIDAIGDAIRAVSIHSIKQDTSGNISDVFTDNSKSSVLSESGQKAAEEIAEKEKSFPSESVIKLAVSTREAVFAAMDALPPEATRILLLMAPDQKDEKGDDKEKETKDLASIRQKLGEAAERAVVGLGSKVGPGWKEKVKEHLTDEAMAGLREHVHELVRTTVPPHLLSDACHLVNRAPFGIPVQVSVPVPLEEIAFFEEWGLHNIMSASVEENYVFGQQILFF